MSYAYPHDTIRYELASISQRFIALVVDSLILGFITSALFFGLRNPGGAIGLAGTLIYQWYFLTRNNGQTPGKMLMGIRVVKANGTAITDGDALIRALGYYLNSALIMLGWLWAFANEKRQGLHDKIVGTYVVRA